MSSYSFELEFDKEVYNAGELVNLTITVLPKTITVTAVPGNTDTFPDVSSASASFQVSGYVKPVLSDNDPENVGDWTNVSQTGPVSHWTKRFDH